MSSLSTLPKGDSAWLLRKSIQRIMQQVSVLETNIGSSTTGNSANTQVIFNDNGTLRGDTGLTFNKTTDLLTVTGAATITGNLTVQSNVNAPSSVAFRYGPSAATWAGLRFDSTNQTFLDSDIALIFRTGGATSFTTAYTIGATGISTWSVGGSTAMTLNATGLGVGTSPSFKLDVQGSGIRLNSGSATGFALLRLGGTASDSFFGFAGNANDIVTGTSAGDTVIGSNKAGANLRFISGNGVINATLDASGNFLVGQTASTNGNLLTGYAFNYNSGASQFFIGHQTGTASGTTYEGFSYNGTLIGSITQNGTTGVLYNITSDYRLKESVQPLVGGLARVSALKPSIYKWKSDGSNGEGFLAHELAEVVPFAVSGEKDAVNEDGSIKSQGIDMSRVVPILVAAIQELTARVQTLEAK